MLRRHIAALVGAVLLATTPACDQGPDDGTWVEDDAGEQSRDPYAPQSWQQRSAAEPDAEPERESEPAATGSEHCGPGTTYWVGSFGDSLGTQNQFDLTMVERPVEEFLSDYHPCLGMITEPTHAVIGYTGPLRDEQPDANGLRDDTQICFTVGESYGMQIYRGWFETEDCSLDGSFAGHSGSYPFSMTLSE